MAQLNSQYGSGTQFSAGVIAGSALGASGLNPMVDRLNSISTSDNLITGSVISGTSTNITTPYQDGNSWTGSLVSGTSTEYFGGGILSGTAVVVYASGGFIDDASGRVISGINLPGPANTAFWVNHSAGFTPNFGHITVLHGVAADISSYIMSFAAGSVRVNVTTPGATVGSVMITLNNI